MESRSSPPTLSMDYFINLLGTRERKSFEMTVNGNRKSSGSVSVVWNKITTHFVQSNTSLQRGFGHNATRLGTLCSMIDVTTYDFDH